MRVILWLLYDGAFLSYETKELPIGRALKIPSLSNPRYYAINFEISAEGNKPPKVCNNTKSTFGSPTINRPNGGGDYLNLILHPSFPCPGYIVSFKIFRKVTGIGFIGIWRPVPDQVNPLKFKLLHIIQIESGTALTEKTVTLLKPLPIEKDDVYSVIHKKNHMHIIANDYAQTDYPSVYSEDVFYENVYVGFELNCGNSQFLNRIYSIEFTIDKDSNLNIIKSNLARGKQSFQSSIAFFNNHLYKPEYANDEHIEIGDKDKYFKCSKTAEQPESTSWWSIDLASVYEITEICLLNIDSDEEYLKLQKFTISIFNDLDDNTGISKYFQGQVNRPISVDIDDYSCYNINSTVGSIVKIELTTPNTSLIICDVIISGKYFRNSKFNLLNFYDIKRTESGGQHLNFFKENAYDRNYSTKFLSIIDVAVENIQSYLLIDMAKIKAMFYNNTAVDTLTLNSLTDDIYYKNDTFWFEPMENLRIFPNGLSLLKVFNIAVVSNSIATFTTVMRNLLENRGYNVHSITIKYKNTHTYCMKFPLELIDYLYMYSQKLHGLNEIDLLLIPKFSFIGWLYYNIRVNPNPNPNTEK
ncbi:DgyrCDS14396 [Dimorphilus gyrociliatus]|uniref:DgyrCDS14396 n=1 Tax=Dimorphilus gyrociliatus TaxID=2664684 RepID=A0A7I8WDN8_9ANNE|nr:DgyrCDS14396 [Dimorphilus gyrociliatus]